MNDFVYNLPPSALQKVKCGQENVQGYLKLQVNHISFIIPKDIKIKSKIIGKKIERSINTSSENSIIKNKSTSSDNEICKEIVSSVKSTKDAEKERNCKRNKLCDSVNVKIVLGVESAEDVANISTSYKSQIPQAEHLKLKAKRKYRQHLNRRHDQEHKQQHKQLVTVSNNNRLRYRICTSGALFLDYLRSCKPIKIIVTSGGSCSCSTTLNSLGQAKLSFPLVLIKKICNNIGKGHNFEYKTKVYALYKQNKEILENNTSEIW